MPRLLRRLERRIGGKRVAVLDHFDRVRHVVQRHDAQAPRREHLGQLRALLAIVRANDEFAIARSVELIESAIQPLARCQ